MSLSASAWIALSFVDDIAIYLLCKHLAKGNIMATKTTQTAARPMSIEEVMNLLRNEQQAAPAVPSTALGDFVVDKVADAGLFTGRLLEGAATAKATFGDARKLERERQLRRRAERIVAFAS